MSLPLPILLDARWMARGGTGTFTRSLLEGLAALSPPEPWLLWGPPAVADLAWPGATHLVTSGDPAAMFGQRAALRVPKAGLVFHPHQTRPLHAMPAATCVLDLIQLQHPSRLIRAAMEVRLRSSLRAAEVLFTIASSVRTELAVRFNIDPEAVTVLDLPVDAAAASRIAARRAKQVPDRVILTIGRFARHKNHRRLLQAFSRSRFASEGGELHLIGGTVDRLNLGSDCLPPGVRVLGLLDGPSLETAMTGALALVHASLAEGYGLPVAEALVAGVPVVSSPVPALTERGPSGVPMFDPVSVPAITQAIDEAVNLIDENRYWNRVKMAPWLASRPTPQALATQVRSGLSQAY